MKKVISIVLSLLLVLSMAACSAKKPAQTEPTELSTEVFNGWWTLSPNYYEGVIPIVTTFRVDSQSGTWTPYGEMGDPGDTMVCTFPEEGIIRLDMDGLGDQEMRLDGNVLYYTDDGHEAYIRTEQPQFTQKGDYTGTWNLVGEPSNGVSYQLTESHVTKVGADDKVDADYKEQQLTLAGDGQDTLPYLELEGTNVKLYPSADGKVLVEDALTSYNVYAREGAENTAQCTMTKTLLDTALVAEDGNDGQSYHKLGLQPNFSINLIQMEQDEDGYYSQSGTGEVGIWSLDEDLTLTLTFEDGTQQSFDLNDWDGTLDLGDRGQFRA